MGLGPQSVKFLCAAKSMGVDFTDTAMIGRQSFRPDPATLERVFSVLGIAGDADQFLRENPYSEPFFTLLGAKRIVSVDASAYEGATDLHDMNLPIADRLRRRFSAIHDGGTLEHVFNIPQALKNCMEMVRPGGHFTQVNMANNFMGHGFWQLSPELIYRAFSAANGYQVEVVLLHEAVPGGAWYLVRDPAEVRRRVVLCNRVPTLMMTVARRVAVVEIFASPPQQSDYVVAWDRGAASRRRRGQLRDWLRRTMPRPVRQTLSSALERSRSEKRKLTTFRRAYYRRIDEDALLHGKFV